jgi:hypothetical protein
MTVPDDVVQSNITILEHHAGVLRGAVNATTAWAVARSDASRGYRTVDRKGDERVADLVARALYDIWEGTFLEVRLAQAHDPWVVSLVGHSHDPGDGEENLYVNATGISAEGAATALLNAITEAAEQLRRETVPN